MKVRPSTKGFDKRLRASEKALLAQYQIALDNTRAQLLTIYEKYGTAGELTYAEMTKYNRLNNLFKDVSGEITKLGGKSVTLVDKLAASTYEASYFELGYAVEKAAGSVAGYAVDLRFGGLATEVVKAAIENPMKQIAFDGLKNSMLIKARQTITQGLIQGQSYFEMAKQIKTDFEGRASSAIRIARTEAGRAQSKGEIAAIDYAADNGAVVRKFWISTVDARTRPTHQHMDGKNADDEGYFTLAGVKIEGPMDDALPAEEIINCRCTLGVDVEGVGRGARRYPDGVSPYETYDEWREDR